MLPAPGDELIATLEDLISTGCDRVMVDRFDLAEALNYVRQAKELERAIKAWARTLDVGEGERYLQDYHWRQAGEPEGLRLVIERVLAEK